MAKKKFTPNKVAKALGSAKGLVYVAAKRLGCHPNTIFNYIKQYPVVACAQQMARGATVDLAESKLRVALNKGEPWAILFTLKCQGKDRGYVERQEVTGKDGTPITHEVKVSVFDRIATYRDALRSPRTVGVEGSDPLRNGVRQSVPPGPDADSQTGDVSDGT